MLELAGIHANYGPINALADVSLKVGQGQMVCLLGANGAGKSTTLNCISGLVAVPQGRIVFDGQDLTKTRVEDIVRAGIVQVPEGREIFPAMSVEDNLELGTFLRRDKTKIARDREWCYELFPRLAERRTQMAGTLSGGEQQMMMIGRALMARPRLLMMDEPSLGLSPVLVQQVFETIRTINAEGIPILIVEQNVKVALEVASYGYLLENGEIAAEGPTADLRDSPKIQEAYLGAA